MKYAGANITICATGSSSDEEGVFVDRSTVYQPPDNDTGLRDTRAASVAAAVVKLSSGPTSRLTFFPQRINDGGLGALNFPLDPVSQDPLSSRAWAFQERILLPRKLIYGRDQMYWECKQSLFSEDGARGKPNTPLVEQIVASEIKQAGRERHRHGWPKLVTTYSEGRLTYLSDKLPALAGLAIEVGQATSAEYHAGVWSSHLWQELLWHVHLEPETTPAGYSYVEDFKAYQEKYYGPIPVASERKTHPWLEVLERWREIVTPACPPLAQDTEVRMIRQDPDIGEIAKTGLTLKRPKSYVAPTWSFASVDAPVTYSHTQDAGLGVVAKCIDIRTELAGPNKYGHVKSGSLTLKGPLLPLKSAPVDSKTFFFGARASVGVSEYRSLAGVEIERMFFDIKPVLPCWAMMMGTNSAILVTPEASADEDLRSGLELHENQERWVRVGTSDAMYGFEKWWESAEQAEFIKEITIV